MSNKQERPVKAEVKAGYSRPLVAGVLVTALSGLAGCSSVPDAVNPAEWYKSTVDFFAGEDGEGQVSQENQAGSGEETPIPGEDKAFPELSSVPERPSAPVQGGLVADTDKRKYAQPIARQGEATEMLAAQPPAAPPAPSSEQASAALVSPVQPAPPAMPAAPVVQAPASMPAAPSDAGFASIVPNSITLTPPPSAPAMPANSMASINEDPYGTVVVSSMGIEMAAAAAAPAPTAQPAIAPVIDAQPITTGLRRATSATVGGVKVATILFETGSSGLSRNDRRILGEVVRLHQQRGGTVTVVGHASSRTRNMDPVRHKMVNYSVSVDRADRIAKELRSMGMAPDMIVVDARADNMPLYYESMPSGEAGNRRAEIYFQN
jgi:outer membrane protein OmpA-like peptidoglycan-associated protein